MDTVGGLRQFPAMATPFLGEPASQGVEAVAHVIQVALTPVFLLSGIGTLLNMFNTRLGRVADHTEHLTELAEAEADDDKFNKLALHLQRLRRRRSLLDTSIALAAMGGVATCAAAFVLFLGGLRETEIATGLVLLFGVSLGCTIGALLAFLTDSVLAWHGLRTDGPMPRSKSA